MHVIIAVTISTALTKYTIILKLSTVLVTISIIISYIISTHLL